MKKSINILEEVHEELINKKVYYQYNNIDKDLSAKYRRGRISASNWIGEIVYMFIEKERKFIEEFNNIINKQKEDLLILKDGDFRKGLIDQLEEVKLLIEKKKVIEWR